MSATTGLEFSHDPHDHTHTLNQNQNWSWSSHDNPWQKWVEKYEYQQPYYPNWTWTPPLPAVPLGGGGADIEPTPSVSEIYRRMREAIQRKEEQAAAAEEAAKTEEARRREEFQDPTVSRRRNLLPREAA